MKRFNRTVQTPQETILVASGNQALRTGAFLSGGTALTISDGQLGILSRDLNGTITPNNFISAGTNTTQVKSISVVRGTPYSSNLKAQSPFGIGTLSHLKSSDINAKEIISVDTTLPEIIQYSTVKLSSFTAPTASTDYQLSILLESHTKDVQYAPQKRNTQVQSVTTPATAPTSITDWLLQNLAVKMNRKSILVSGVGYEFVVLGLGTSGGTQVGPIAVGTVIPIEVDGGITVNYTATYGFVKALQKMVTDGNILTTDHIVTMDLSTAGTAATVTSLLVVGLEESPALIYDEVNRNIVHVKSAGVDIACTTTRTSEGREWVGTGKQWQFRWKKRAGMKYYFENWYKMDGVGSVETAPSYITATESQLYTSTIITYNKAENHTTEFTQTVPHTLVILLPAAISNPTATAADTYAVATTATTTVTQLNASLGAWLLHAQTSWNNHIYLNAATAAAPFV